MKRFLLAAAFTVLQCSAALAGPYGVGMTPFPHSGVPNETAVTVTTSDAVAFTVPAAGLKYLSIQNVGPTNDVTCAWNTTAVTNAAGTMLLTKNGGIKIYETDFVPGGGAILHCIAAGNEALTVESF